ncbi:uncharacterized protein ACJ7VT_020292 [Polymixia lowei]
MNSFEEKLCEHVRLYPHLFDSKQRDYKDTQKSTNSWTEIAEAVGCSQEKAKTTWNKLRDKFSKAKKRMLNGTKSRAVDKTMPALYTQLSWLSPYVKHRETNATNSFEEKLCEHVRLYPHLFDSSRHDYKDTHKAFNSWTEIADAVGCSQEEAKCRWNRLRDKFSKAKKRMLNGKKSGGEKTVPALYTQLSWLCPYVKHRETTNMPDDEEGTVDESSDSSLVMAPSSSSIVPDCEPSTPPSHADPSHSISHLESTTEVTVILDDLDSDVDPLSSSPQLNKRKQRRGTKRRAEPDTVAQVMAAMERRSALREKRREERERARAEQDRFARRFTSMIDFARTLTAPQLYSFEIELAQLVFDTQQKMQNSQE